jgi:hypothetical protein
LNEAIRCCRIVVLIAARFDHAVDILGFLRRQRELHCVSSACQDSIFLETRCNARKSYGSLTCCRPNFLLVSLAVYGGVSFQQSSLHMVTCQDAGMECVSSCKSVHSGSKGQASDLPACETPDPCIYCDVKYLASTP